jgi:hypothetical protein
MSSRMNSAVLLGGLVAMVPACTTSPDKPLTLRPPVLPVNQFVVSLRGDQPALEKFAALVKGGTFANCQNIVPGRAKENPDPVVLGAPINKQLVYSCDALIKPRAEASLRGFGAIYVETAFVSSNMQKQSAVDGVYMSQADPSTFFTMTITTSAQCSTDTCGGFLGRWELPCAIPCPW